MPPAKTAKKTIGGTVYEYTLQTLTPATEILSLVGKHIGEPLAPLLRGGLDGDIAPDVIERAATSVVAKIGDPALILDLVRRLNAGGKATIKGTDGKQKTAILSDEGQAEIFFGDRPDELLPWVAFALETQIGPFVGSIAKSFGFDPKALAAMVKAMAKKAQDLASRKASQPDPESSDSQATADGTTAS